MHTRMTGAVLAALLVLLLPWSAQAEFSALVGWEEELQIGAGFRETERESMGFVGYEDTTLEVFAVQGWESRQFEGYLRWHTTVAAGAVSYSYGAFAGNTFDFAPGTRTFDGHIAAGGEGKYVQRTGDFGYGVSGLAAVSRQAFAYSIKPFADYYGDGRWRLATELGSEPLRISVNFKHRSYPLEVEAGWQDGHWDAKGLVDFDQWPLSVGVRYRREVVGAWVQWHF